MNSSAVMGRRRRLVQRRKKIVKLGDWIKSQGGYRGGRERPMTEERSCLLRRK